MFNMSHEQNNSQNQFAAWGKAQQKNPARNVEMKNVALFSLKPSQKKASRYFHWAQYVMSVVTVLGVVVVTGHITLNRMHMATSSGPGGSVGSTIAPVAYDVSLESSSAAQDSAYNLAREYPLPEQEIGRFKKNVSDTREFLKTYYQATLRTRQVAKLATHIQTMARGYGGRVDNISVNKESAYISFVVPKDKFAMFADELRTLVKPKFIEEIISAQNLLPEKQQIEKRTDVAEQTLSSVKKQRQELVDNHSVVVANLQKRINNYSAQINGLHNQFAATTSTERQQAISNQIAYVTRQQNGVKQELVQENSRYETALRLSDANIAASEKRIDTLYEQDQDLLANVETVESSVSLQWISVWEIVELYVPIYWILSILTLGGLIGYFRYGRRQKLLLP